MAARRARYCGRVMGVVIATSPAPTPPASRERSRRFHCVRHLCAVRRALLRTLVLWSQEEIRLCNCTVQVRCDELQEPYHWIRLAVCRSSFEASLVPTGSQSRRRESTPIAVLNDHNRIYPRLRPSSTALVWMMTSHYKTSLSLPLFDPRGNIVGN
ncbi:uncharacterized protein LOC119589272 [Penaeus monodon]|uniref:uncharacterized protein LOC119589272 n=1 Tax=Penaeus monodon TaxID=6687 RepID=UPI0018A7C0CD|nr:uncharacterized protein LOC119589272 [Penaeus monodon]